MKYWTQVTKKNPFHNNFDAMELNDLVRDLNLSKKLSELLASRLSEKNLLMPDVKTSYFRQREQKLIKYFNDKDDYVYCTDIKSLLNDMGVANYCPDDWRLFIDSSKQSLKCVLLHNRNIYGSIPIAHSVKAKKTYENYCLF